MIQKKGVNIVEEKKKYELAEVELIRFDVMDIITTSNTGDDGSGDDGGGWTNPDKPYINWG